MLFRSIEKNGTTTAEVQMAAEALIAAGVKAVFTPTAVSYTHLSTAR